MYTGGITEAQNGRLEIFGEARLREGSARLQGMDSKAMMAKIFDETKIFCGNAPQSDDITLMSITMG